VHPLDSTFPDQRGSDLLSAVRSELALTRLAEAEYFEFRLGASEQVDYLVAIPRRQAALACRLAREVCHRRSLSHQAVWCRLEQLFEAWASGGSLISSQSPAMWLEFDQLCSPVPQLGAPSVSVCLVPGYRTDEPLSAGNSVRTRELIAEALHRLDVENTTAAAREVADCFTLLPDGARWIHLSVMLGRVPSAVKLYGSVRRETLLPFLQGIGWRGDLGAIATALDGAYAPGLVGRELLIDLNLDNFRDPGRASLGMAVGQQQVARGPWRELSRARVLEAWVALGLATPERAAVASAWACATSDRAGVFTDLKLVWQAGVGFSAKAYLGRHAVSAEQLARLAEQWRLARETFEPMDHGQ